MGGNVYKGLVAEEVRSEIHETPSVNSVVSSYFRIRCLSYVTLLRIEQSVSVQCECLHVIIM